MEAKSTSELFNIYDGIGRFSEGLTVAQKGNMRIFIYPDGTPAFEAVFSEALPFSEGLAAVKTGEEWVYIGHNGKPAFEGRYAKANSFSCGTAQVKDGKWFTIIDHYGKRVENFPPQPL
ncbi:MAG: WG repeat-containing protein [Candidatus Staskawiczbacteria bacterium]|nr:WG repeat-containing protein [Candidatus Staskawiczbacteria bacterium]